MPKVTSEFVVTVKVAVIHDAKMTLEEAQQITIQSVHHSHVIGSGPSGGYQTTKISRSIHRTLA